jgi:hypothetical protein
MIKVLRRNAGKRRPFSNGYRNGCATKKTTACWILAIVRLLCLWYLLGQASPGLQSHRQGERSNNVPLAGRNMPLYSPKLAVPLLLVCFVGLTVIMGVVVTLDIWWWWWL